MTESVLTRIDTAQNRLILAAVGMVMLAALLYYLIRALRRRAAWRRLDQSIIEVGSEYVRNVLIPDGMGASMHVDYLLLTARGVLVIDLRDIRGNIFGGDQMTDWTVMNGANRSTFINPQHALYDRVAAVRQLSADMPVEGRILFTRRGKFPKGLPRWTLMVDSLPAEFPPVDSDATQNWVGRYREAWQSLCAAVAPSPLRQRRGFLAQVFAD